MVLAILYVTKIPLLIATFCPFSFYNLISRTKLFCLVIYPNLLLGHTYLDYSTTLPEVKYNLSVIWLKKYLTYVSTMHCGKMFHLEITVGRRKSSYTYPCYLFLH